MNMEDKGELVPSTSERLLPSAVGTPLTSLGAQAVAETDHGIASLPAASSSAAAVEFASFAHEQVREYIQLADQKAAFLFGAGSALLAFLHSQKASTAWIVAPREWGLRELLSFLSAVGLVTALAIAASVVFPRTHGATSNLLSWVAISKRRSAGEFSREVREAKPEMLAASVLSHTYELATVCARKYKWLRRCFIAAAIGFGAAVTYMVLVRAA